jgi:fructokinase
MTDVPRRPRLGIDLGGTKIHGVIVAPDGTLARQRRIATPRHDYPGTLQAIVELVRQLDPDRQCPVGIGTPGSLMPESGLMHNCNSTWLNHQPLLADLRQQLGPDVRIANDADCFALSEAHGGAGEGAACVFGAILGTGVGGGIVVAGQLLSGPGGLSGEWGHNSMPMEVLSTLPRETRLRSRQCYCDRLNCLESYLSGPGLARTHEELWGQRLTAEELHAAALGDETSEALADDLLALGSGVDPRVSADSPIGKARVTLSCYCRMLAMGLAQVVNIVDPDVIVFGGGISKIAAIYQPVSQMLESAVFGGRGRTRIAAPVFGDASGVRGAAWLWPDTPAQP